MDRIIIFTDFSTLLVPTLLINATLKAATGMSNFQIAGICVRNFEKYHHLMYRHSRTILKTKVKTFFDTTQHQKFSRPLPINIDKLARQHRFKLLIPPKNNINDAGFIRQMKTKLKPTVALSFYCLQKFSPALLKTFKYAVNYHNGLLPTYRGLMATCWSVYHQDSATGYTFHRLNEKIDDGNTLIKGRVPVTADSSVSDLEHEKAVLAAKDIPGLLKIIIKREPGQVQAGSGNYYSKKDSEKIILIDNPSKYSQAELISRLRAFGALRMNIKGVWYDITKLERLPAPPNNTRTIYFQTSDGMIMRPVRFRFLPFSMYRILKRGGWAIPSITTSPDAQ